MPTPTRSRFLSGYVALACTILIIPIIIVGILAFSDQSYMQFPPRAYSMRWFRAFFGDPMWQQSLRTSFMVALIACGVSTIIGFFAAYAFVRNKIGNKKLLLSFMLLPIIIPSVITAIALYFVSNEIGLIGNIVWLGICHAAIALPIVLLILMPSLHGTDPNLERAALSLGCSRFDVFRKIVVPLALPGISSAMLFAFLASFDELLISLFLTGVRAETLPVRIWNSLLLQVEPIIAAVSVFLIGVTAVVLILDSLIRVLRRKVIQPS